MVEPRERLSLLRSENPELVETHLNTLTPGSGR